MHTTILGHRFAGRPFFGSFALRLWLIERRQGTAAAQAMLDATNQCRVHLQDKPPLALEDLRDDFTTLPFNTSLVTCPAGPAKGGGDAHL